MVTDRSISVPGGKQSRKNHWHMQEGSCMTTSLNIRCHLRLLGFFLSASGLFVLPQRAQAESDHLEKLPGLLKRLTEKNHGYGGGVLRVSDSRGLVWEGADGLVAGPGSAPMQTDTPFEIASITKMVTAVTILKLVEEGKIRLDSRVEDLLPAELAKGFGNITLEQLLTHTSGLPDYWDDKSRGFLRTFRAEPGRMWKPGDILSYARAMPARPAGKKFQYADTNYVLLGLIIEQATKQPLHRAFREMIFDPLGMNDTWLTYRENPRGCAPSHRFEGKEDLHAVPRQSADWAGGGLMSTTRDLERLLRGMVEGRLFQRAATLDLMRRAVPVGEEGITYGKGVYRVELDHSQGELWGHDGHGNSFAYYWPEGGLFFTGTLNQTQNDWWPLVKPFFTKSRVGFGFQEESRKFDAAISTGWDSLYMFRGVNALRGDGKYGNGIAWTDVNLAWNPGENDAFTVDLWNCFATRGDAYREFDLNLAYTRSLGNLSLACGYSFYYGYAPQNFFSHELGAMATYEIEAGPLTLAPSLGYFFNIGPDSADGQGFSKAASGFLQLRLDGHLPVYRDIIALEPWGALGVSFQYNTKTAPDGEPVPFSGANNLEWGVSIPVKITANWTVSAYSRAFTSLNGTNPDTFWGGASILLAF